MPLPTLAGEFRVVADPELRFTPSGKAVCEVRLVASKRKNNGTRENPDWVDDKTLWLSGSIWGTEAENTAESLDKGMLVEVRGAIYTDDWEDKEGNKRQSTRLQIYGIGPSMNYGSAKVTKVERSTGAPVGQQQSAPAEDPWATGPAQSDEPPF